MSDLSSPVPAPPDCDCEGLWNDAELRMGPEARDSYNRTGHLPGCLNIAPPAVAVPAPEDTEKLLDNLCEAVGEFQDVSDAWAKGTAETYLMEYAQKDVNAARERISAEVSRLRSLVLTPEEAGLLVDLIEHTPMKYPPELNLLWKKLRRRLSSDSGGLPSGLPTVANKDPRDCGVGEVYGQ